MAPRLTPGRIVGFVPARGGSKSIPLKNIRPLAGRPLIYWVLDALTRCERIDDVYVSTDDPQIASVVNAYGRNVKVVARSKETATDEAPTELALLEFAAQVDFEHICLVQATSPLLKSDDLDRAIQRYLEAGYDSLLSVVRQKRFLWDVRSDGSAFPINYDPYHRPRRQEMEGVLVENGAFYITRREALVQSRCRISGRIGVYEMEPDTYLELDEPEDWTVIETLVRRRAQSQSRRRLANIRVLVMDVDGVLTDAGMYYGLDGEALKKFNTRDGKGVELVRQAGVVPVIMTSEDTPIVSARARKLQIAEVYVGVRDKAECLRQLCVKLQVPLEAVAFIGDDLNDLEALHLVGFSASPADAVREVRDVVHYVCSARGGEGCVREVCDLIVESRRTGGHVPTHQ